MTSYLDVLNNEQRQAVLHSGRGLLILAGAGSGKTRVITTKIAYLIREQGYDPRSILAVTFTNKAAREMAERARLIDERAGFAMLRTFHSFGAWFLRRNAEAAGLNSNFVIYDDDDVVSLLSTIAENLDRKELRAMASLISRAKDYGFSPDNPKLDTISYKPDFRKLYSLYQERLQKIGNVDFGDLIRLPVELLKANPDIAFRIHERFKVILVDEYQDSNVVQEQLLNLLVGEQTYICVVGDDDQSIYRFRGAEVQNILEFPKRFTGTDIIRLEQNYRSYSHILDLASSVVDHNTGRLGKKLWTERGKGKTPVLAFVIDQDIEAKYCADLIKKSIENSNANTTKNITEQKTSYNDWAILYRTNAQSLSFETELLHRNIPYKVVGTLKFFEREEIKDALALLALLVNPWDEVAFRRVINKPARGIGAGSIEKIFYKVYSSGPAYSATAANKVNSGLINIASGVTLSAKAAAGIKAFAAFMEKASLLLDEANVDAINAAKDALDKNSIDKSSLDKSPIKAGEGLSVCVATLILDSGLAEYHSTHDQITGFQRLGNLQELVNSTIKYPANRQGLASFLESIELDRAIEDDKDANKLDAVTLITLHNTKGLEFKKVIITGLEQGVFPRDDKYDEDIEEERRLFYVGVTRAMDELYLSSCAMRRMYGKTSPMMPSRFLYEADKSTLRIIGNAPAGFKNTPKKDHANIVTFSGKTSSDGRWKQGDRVFHDDQGYGQVIAISESDDGPLVKVRFDNRHETTFLSLYQSKKFTKISYDDY